MFQLTKFSAPSVALLLALLAAPSVAATQHNNDNLKQNHQPQKTQKAKKSPKSSSVHNSSPKKHADSSPKHCPKKSHHSSSSGSSSSGSSSSSSTSSSSSSGVIREEPENNFSLSNTVLSYSGSISPFSDSIQVTWSGFSGSLIEPSEALYLVVDLGDSGLIADSIVSSPNSVFNPELTFTSTDLVALGEGVHKGELLVKACKDAACVQEYKGSPQILPVVISVVPNSNPDTACEHQDGNIFIDCVDPSWLGASAWEISKPDGLISYHYFNSNNDSLIQWDAIDTGELDHNTVLDVQFSDKSANGTFRFHSLGAFQYPKETMDMSQYATGSIEFDVRVLDWGSNTTGLVATTECGWPCTSGEISLGMPVLAEWTHYSLSVAEILNNTQGGQFDLSQIDIGFSIFPRWDDMAGVHFQLDNVRWAKGDESNSVGDAAFKTPSAPIVFNIDASYSSFEAAFNVGLDNAQEITPVFYSVDLSAATFISAVSFSVEGGSTSAAMNVQVNDIAGLTVGKTYKDTITVNACADIDCNIHYPGSPSTVEFIGTVIPSVNPDIHCDHVDGNIFIDCVDPTWLGASAWELTSDGLFTNYHYFEGDGDFLIQWQTVATDEVGHDTVLQIHYTDKPANGSFRFQSVGSFESPPQAVDMTDYATGTIEFDVKVLDWGNNTSGLVASVECVWPCSSGEIPLAISPLDQWQHYSLPISDMLAKEQPVPFDLSRIAIGLVISPVWDQMNGVTFQLDNVRWLKSL